MVYIIGIKVEFLRDVRVYKWENSKYLRNIRVYEDIYDEYLDILSENWRSLVVKNEVTNIHMEYILFLSKLYK